MRLTLIRILSFIPQAYTVWSFNALMVEFLTNVAKERKKNGGLKQTNTAPRSSKSSGLFAIHQHLPQFAAANERYQEAEDLLINLLEQDDHDPHHMFPFNLCLKPWRKGRHFLGKCRSGVLQCACTTYFFRSASASTISPLPHPSPMPFLQMLRTLRACRSSI